MTETADCALADLRVVDLSDSIGGQYCARLFADHGAEVTLLEPPGGSLVRSAPPLSTTSDGGSFLFAHLNLGKGSIVLDRDGPGAASRLSTLLRAADVAILPAGFEPEAVRAANPACVSVSVQAFGGDGPLAGWKGPEIVLQALSGMMVNNGAFGREPLYGCGHRASFAAGLAAYIGATAALLARTRTGRGQHVSVAEAETAAAMGFPYLVQHIYSGVRRSRADQNIPAGQVLCRGSWVCIWIYNHRWSALCAALDLGDLERDPRFAEPATRRDNWTALFEIIQARVADRDADELVARLQRAEVIAAKAERLTETLASAHLKERGYWQRLPDGSLALGPPYRFSRTPRRVPAPPPKLGEDRHGLASLAEAPSQPPVPATTDRAAPLAGLRVLELTTAWAGPMSGRVLGFLGADVIHVESPNRVNSWRLNKETPNPINFPNGEPGERPFDRSFLFNSQNINKRSCILDLKTERGRELLRGLVAVSDVLICNFRPGTLDRLGLGYERLRAIKPDIVVAELPAFGGVGPMSRFAALGPTMEMATGMASLVGYRDGQPETTGPSYLDPIGGFNAASAILTALLHRQRTGEGQYVEIPQVEAAMHFIGADILAAAETGRDPERDGNRSPWAAPHDAFPAAGEDEWLVVAARDEDEWHALCEAIGQPELARDPRFATLADRRANEDALSAIIAAWSRTRSKHEAASHLQRCGVPAAPVRTAEDLAHSDDLARSGFFTWLEHPDAGRHPYPTLPIRLSLTPGGQFRAAPVFGGDTRVVLRDLVGLDERALEAAREAGVIADAPLPGA
ncbi:CoA transferase [Alsobacter sp. SYSU M60028]|uniref:CoA transferase n=1 Tax=Alsobacter ponti TaxID=2962936 RepID=A0ABT1LIW6_9HYPH|nr:CoA transferase [Alsobacter ponti]